MIFIVILGCLFPLAIYFSTLASLNRLRPHPVMIAGSWDLAGLLFGCSGFLLVAGPFILSTLNQRLREIWLYADPNQALGKLGNYGWFIQVTLWLGYFVLVVGVSIIMLWRRRRMTSIYNVDPAILQDVFGQGLDRLKREWQQAGNRILIGSRDPAAYQTDGAATASLQVTPLAAVAGGDNPAPSPVAAVAMTPDPPADRTTDPTSLPEAKVVVELIPFPAMRHADLWWPADAGVLRQQVEGELSRSLAEIETRDNPAGSWFLSLSGSLLAVIFFTLLFLVIFYVLLRLRGG